MNRLIDHLAGDDPRLPHRPAQHAAMANALFDRGARAGEEVGDDRGVTAEPHRLTGGPRRANRLGERRHDGGSMLRRALAPLPAAAFPLPPLRGFESRCPFFSLRSSDASTGTSLPSSSR
mgnify:CR=1 FL=1